MTRATGQLSFNREWIYDVVILVFIVTLMWLKYIYIYMIMINLVLKIDIPILFEMAKLNIYVFLNASVSPACSVKHAPCMVLLSHCVQ